MKAYFITSKCLEFSGSGLSFEKEVIYVGTFKKKGVEYHIDEELIDNWVTQFVALSERGFTPKLPVEHTFDPEKNRGKITKLYKKLDNKGRIGLFAHIEFNDVDAAKLVKTTDVSIYSPPYYTLGDGYTANRPITHVALTDYPVVPGLAPFETLAASLYEENTMTLKALAEALGMTVPEGADDTAISEMIVAEFAKLKKPAEEKPAEDPAPKEGDTVQASLMNSLLLDNRCNKIELLVRDRKMTPAEAIEWRKTYADKATLNFSNNDGFDVAFSLASKRSAIFEPGSKTPTQQLDPENNPLLKDAKRRKENS
jgi:hypothetical protein